MVIINKININSTSLPHYFYAFYLFPTVPKLPVLSVHSKLKEKLMEITNENEQRKLELKSKVEKHKNQLFEYRTKPLLLPPFAKSFEVFAKNDNSIVGNTHNSVTQPNPINNEEDQGTEIPEALEITNKLPEIEDVDDDDLKKNDDDFILIDNKKDFPSVRNTKQRRLISKSELTKREIDNVIPESELAKTKYTIIEKLKNESSAEKNERINRGLQKVMQFVGVMGQVDSYLTDQTRTLIKKLALLCEYDEKEKRKG